MQSDETDKRTFKGKARIDSPDVHTRDSKSTAELIRRVKRHQEELRQERRKQITGSRRPRVIFKFSFKVSSFNWVYKGYYCFWVKLKTGLVIFPFFYLHFLSVKIETGASRGPLVLKCLMDWIYIYSPASCPIELPPDAWTTTGISKDSGEAASSRRWAKSRRSRCLTTKISLFH